MEGFEGHLGAGKSEAERLEDAADLAHKDGDFDHERELRKRAQSARRQARERMAGVRPLWG